MDVRHLAILGQNAKTWAQTYTRLVEALLQEGVEEPTAREEARAAANFAILMADDEVEPDICPTCGTRGAELTTSGDDKRYFSCKQFHQWTHPFPTHTPDPSNSDSGE